MQYLITTPNDPPFLTNWYSFENNYIKGMVVYDLINYTYSTDGKIFNPITEDNL